MDTDGNRLRRRQGEPHGRRTRARVRRGAIEREGSSPLPLVDRRVWQFRENHEVVHTCLDDAGDVGVCDPRDDFADETSYQGLGTGGLKRLNRH